MLAKKTITILGATGSIGLNTLDVIRRHSDRFQVFALTAHRKQTELLHLCREFKPRFAVLHDASQAEALQQSLRVEEIATEVLCGVEALCSVAAHPEVSCVMAAIVGAAGLPPTLAAARAGKRILLANKEALVMAGQLFMDTVRQAGATLLPIDSEHNAIFQSLPGQYQPTQQRHELRRLILTASGGPFRTLPLEAFANITPAQACAHPNWVMGQKISVDSATMMNKGLEVIEARWLFDMPHSLIDVVIHPQSIVHSMVEYVDGSVLAQLGQPDMRTPIANALAYPERIESGVASLNFVELARLDFSATDTQRFPCLGLAYNALEMGQSACTALNAANEICVAAFLQGQIRFLDIAQILRNILQQHQVEALTSLDDVLALDCHVRAQTQSLLECMSC